MRRHWVTFLGTGLLLLGLSARADAQARGYVGGGLGIAIPVGSFSDGDKLGWLAQVIAGINGPKGKIGGRVDATYSHHGFKGGGGHDALFGANGDVVLNLGMQGAKAHPYLLGGVGFYNVKSSETTSSVTVSVSETKAAFNVGGGVNITSNKNMAVYIEGRFISVLTSGSSLNFIPLSVGVRWGGH